MNIYIPYFYIIKHIPSGKLYAGSKFGKDANPSNFMIDSGYTTSSKIINSLIEKNGLNSFLVLKIKTFKTGLEAYNYETRFLTKSNAASNPKFINAHNNKLITFGTPQYRNLMIKLYGVEHNSQLESTKLKRVLTYKTKTGYDYPTQNPEVLIKRKLTKLEKYGSENYHNTSKMKETLENKYGVDSWAKTPEGILNSKYLMQKVNSAEHYCIWCSKTIVGPNYNKWHGDNCKLNPNSLNKNRTFNKFQCKFCLEYFAKHIFGQFHGNYCKLNPDRIIKPKSKQRSRKVCDRCNNNIDSSNFSRHYSICKG